MKKLIINADDFGMSKEVNAGVKQGIKAGVLTSVSVMTNMPFFEDAVLFLKKHPEVKVGLHFNITEGHSLLWPNKVSSLLREDNDFFSLPVTVLRLFLRQVNLTEVHNELIAQYTALAATGLPISHIDSHHHIHLHPSLFRVVLNFTKNKEVPWVRCRRFDFHNMTNGLKLFPNIKQVIILLLSLINNISFRSYRELFVTDSLYDLNWDTTISETKFLRILSHLPEGITMIICHPAIMSKTGNKKFLTSREHCLNLITRPNIRKKIQAALKLS